ncbi:cytochrome P450 [Endozoicomonas montiporae]|uniref:Cytochrome P450 n=2 Tax=Endozoicomonas montiporae TaxID=1027273 RepID=A0A081NAT1_9GAMM|nr:cytochrome P450 [Endozoicomonas montiporae]AMO56752.1 cytochrome P450 [Endozoicomonas montiporae CL-33]KEQ15554.1 cytochrome P450 [Endozoicomonas montiporae]
MTQEAQVLSSLKDAPIEQVFRPNSLDYSVNPVPQCLALAERGRLVWFPPWQAWIMTRMDDIMDCWKREYLSSDLYDWQYAPEVPPKEEWSNFETAMIGHSLLADPTHHRLIRKIASPAFSRNVVDEIQRRIEPDIKKLIANLKDRESFDFIEEIAQHIPFISITRMVGVPEQYWEEMKPVIMKFTEAWNPTLTPERREAARQASSRAIDILKLVMAERRDQPLENDFLSVLLEAEKKHEDFEEWDVITLILALIGAGADTTLVGQQWTAYSLLKHKDQIDTALSSLKAFRNAFSEIMRWSCKSKMGFARYAPEDMELLGQQVKKGQMILLMPHLKDRDPDYYEDPDTFNVERVFDPDVLFGYGPRFCIGASLAKSQLYLTMTELFKQFPNLELDGEPERSLEDHNAVTFKKLMLKTNNNR